MRWSHNQSSAGRSGHPWCDASWVHQDRPSHPSWSQRGLVKQSAVRSRGLPDPVRVRSTEGLRLWLCMSSTRAPCPSPVTSRSQGQGRPGGNAQASLESSCNSPCHPARSADHGNIPSVPATVQGNPWCAVGGVGPCLRSVTDSVRHAWVPCGPCGCQDEKNTHRPLHDTVPHGCCPPSNRS